MVDCVQSFRLQVYVPEFTWSFEGLDGQARIASVVFVRTTSFLLLKFDEMLSVDTAKLESSTTLS